MSEYFPELKSSGGRVKVEIDLSNYATKTDLKNETGADTSKFAEKVYLASLKSNVDKLDIDKLKNVPTNLSNLKSKVDKLDVDKLAPVPVNLSKLSDVVKNDAFKKDVYHAKIKDVKDKIPDITNLATKTTIIAKINQVKYEIPNITNLATTTALTATENKTLSVSDLGKKLTITQTLVKLKRKLLIIIMINILLLQNLISLLQKFLKRANLASKSDVANFVKKTDFDNKLKDVTSNKNELNELSKKVKAISTKGLTKDLIDKFSILNGAKYFSSGIFENYLVFIPANKYIKYLLALLGLNCGNLMGYQKKVLKI